MNNDKVEFLKENYSKLGLEACVKILNESEGAIKWQTSKYKLKVNPEVRSKLSQAGHKKRKLKEVNDYKVNADLFMSNFTAESSYLLGLIWADGYLFSSSVNSKGIKIECKSDDINCILSVFNSTGKWNQYFRERIGRSHQTIMHTTNNILYNFLKDYDFCEKSIKSPDKILSIIPMEYKKYFFRGWIDGDGCFYQHKHMRQFVIAGSYEQNWTAFENLCKKLSINFTLSRKLSKNGNSSIIRFGGRESICKLHNYVYSNFINDKIGLTRKYEKSLKCFN